MRANIKMAAIAFAIACATFVEGDGNATVAPPRDKTLIVVGKVFSISQGGSRLKPWVVTIEIEKIERGEYVGSWFSFRVHSPSRSGLKEGHSYRVTAQWHEEGYEVDESQWRKLQPFEPRRRR